VHVANGIRLFDKALLLHEISNGGGNHLNLLDEGAAQ
jgi:hypothetical protein